MTGALASDRVWGRRLPASIRRVVARPVAWMTAICSALALLVGLPSIWYPFGRDQGLFYYAAREWLLRGQVLYRDVWDHKPPIIYFVYMTAIGLMGEHPWAIRVLELLVAVPALGWCAAGLSRDPGERPRADVFAVGWLGVALCYYGYFTFWDQAQCEIWSVLFVALALVSVLHARRAAVGAISGGALCAFALFTKPPAVFFVGLCAAAVIWRARNDGGGARAVALRSLQWTLGVGAVAGALLGYFAARGALADMIDIVVGANAVYVADERTFETIPDMWAAAMRRFSSMEPFSASFIVVVLGALLAGVARRDWSLVRPWAGSSCSSSSISITGGRSSLRRAYSRRPCIATYYESVRPEAAGSLRRRTSPFWYRSGCCPAPRGAGSSPRS